MLVDVDSFHVRLDATICCNMETPAPFQFLIGLFCKTCPEMTLSTLSSKYQTFNDNPEYAGNALHCSDCPAQDRLLYFLYLHAIINSISITLY